MAALSKPVSSIALRQAAQQFIGIGTQSVTVDVCIQECGEGYKPYTQLEVVLAVSSWVIPLFVLVFNVHMSNLRVGAGEKLCRMRRSMYAAKSLSLVVSYSAVLARLMGNPILFLFNHLEQFADMRRIKKAAKGEGDMAVLGITLDDFGCSGVIQEYLGRKDVSDERKLAFREVCSEAAGNARNNRVSSIRRSAMAVAAYTTALFLALRTNIIQNSVAVHTPHTIALRELYYWLFSAVAFSSATGAFPTQRSAEDFLKPVIRFMGNDEYRLSPLGLWTGGSYACRPQSRLTWGSVARMSLATTMVVGAWAFAFVTSWFTPTRGLGCRSLMELGFTGAWVLNFIISQMLQRWKLKGAEILTFAFDTVLAVPMVVCLFTAFKGWYNSCRCWGAQWTAVISHIIPANIQQSEHDQTGMYYGFIAGAVGFQVFISVCVLLHYRHELSLIYGSGEDQTAEDVSDSTEALTGATMRSRDRDVAGVTVESRSLEDSKPELAVSVREYVDLPRPGRIIVSRTA